MAYKVIALKHRPRTFSEIVAQDHITLTLKNAVTAGRIHNGYLFAGPRGTGKTTTARVLSKALNCENPRDGEPCDQCVSCNEITSANSPNVIEIDAASNRGIDDIRQLRESIRYTPIGAKYKIYIIDEVHQLTNEAFNALLKTLEEPPAHGIFILATTEAQKVPATIMSRCLRFDFRLVTLERLIETVENICAKEGVETERGGIEAICMKADGSIRDAYSLLDQVISTGITKIDAEVAAEVLGLVNSKLLTDISSSIAKPNAVEAVNYFNSYLKSGGNVEYFVDSLSKHLRDLLVIKMNSEGESIPGITDDLLPDFRAIADRFDEGQLLRMLNIVAELFSGLRRKTVDPVIAVELALIKMGNLDKTIDIQKLLAGEFSAPSTSGESPDLFGKSTPPAQSAELKKKDEVIAIPRVVDDQADESETGELDIDVINRNWDRFISGVNKKKKMLWAHLNGSEPSILEGNILILRVPHNGIAKTINLPANQKFIEKLTREVFGKSLRFEFNVETSGTQNHSGERVTITAPGVGATGDRIVDSILEEFEDSRLINWEPRKNDDD
ncbi:MAG: DNA polymerase III subunit gamma/tau [candidate division Zixibacteria bacterium]|nr:DNA polymerase III subunit gamma/tau [candidate division Zixibacteria bacterium]